MPGAAVSHLILIITVEQVAFYYLFYGQETDCGKGK